MSARDSSPVPVYLVLYQACGLKHLQPLPPHLLLDKREQQRRHPLLAPVPPTSGTGRRRCARPPPPARELPPAMVPMYLMFFVFGSPLPPLPLPLCPLLVTL